MQSYVKKDRSKKTSTVDITASSAVARWSSKLVAKKLRAFHCWTYTTDF